SPGLFAGQPATPRARSTGFRGPPGSRDARRSAPPRRRPGSSASRTGSGEARREPHGARKEPSPRTRSPRHQRRRSCTTPPRSRPPAQSTIGSSTSTLSQWCSWSTQAPPCWTSEGTGLVILFLSLSISLSDFSPSSGLAVCFRRGARDCHGAKGSFRKQSFSTTQLLRGHVLQAYRF
ncbi:unnamed protein product, partial [Prorocentrum cordatum]